MSSSIHYKFRTTNVSKTLAFDGQAIKVPELKKAICAAENIKAELFDLVFFNSFNKQPYTGDDEIPRNSSVTVQRVPIENGAKIPKISNPEISAATKPTSGVPDSAAHIKQEDFSKMTEEERIKHITIQSTFKYTTNNYNRKPMANNMQQAPPDYLCNRCNQLGHFPKACPLLNIRKTTGIPNEELMETTADDPQAMLHPSGKFMIPIMHYKAREQRKLMEEQKKKGLPNSQEQKYKAVKKELPSDLKCPICNDIYKEALVTGCCGESFCADCIQQTMSDAIAADLTPQCPNCKTPIGASALFPNNSLRESVDKYKKALAAAPAPAPEANESEEDDEPVTNEPEPVSSPETPQIEKEKTPDQDVENASAPPVVEGEKPVVLPTVNLSAMLAAAQKTKQSSLPPPEPVVDFSQPPPNILSQPPPTVLSQPPPPIIPPVVLPVVDFSKPPPNFKLPDLSQPPPFIPPNVPKVNKEVIVPLPQIYNVPPPKPIISESKYDEKDEEAINSVWEKLNVGDDALDLATLFETRTSYVKLKDEDSDGKEKEKRTKRHRSKSRERHRREDRRSRSRSPHKKRKDSREREVSSKKRSREPEYRHKSLEKRSSDNRRKDKVKENGKDREKEKERKEDKERKEGKRKSDEQKESITLDRERHRKLENDDDKQMPKYENDDKKAVKHEKEIKKDKEKEKERKLMSKTPSESPKKTEIFIDKEDTKKASSSSQETVSRLEVKERVKEKEPKKEKVKEKEREKLKHKDSNGKEREKEKKKDKERDHNEKSEKKKSSKRDKSLDTVEREKDKEKKKSSSKEKKKSKSEEKKKKKRRKSSDQSDDEEEEKQKKKRHKEKKHKKDRKRVRESLDDDDDSEHDRRKRRKF